MASLVKVKMEVEAEVIIPNVNNVNKVVVRIKVDPEAEVMISHSSNKSKNMPPKVLKRGRKEISSSDPESKKITKRAVPLKKISLVVVTLLQRSSTFDLEIDDQFSLLDVLRLLIQQEPHTFGESSFMIQQQPANLYINIGNASDKLINYIPENNVVKLLRTGWTSPKNDFAKAKNIVDVYTHGLEKTINLPGDCLLNLAPLGSWIGFGRGPTQVPPEEDNHIQYLFFVKYENKTFGYNLPAFCKMLPTAALHKLKQDGTVLLIPHLNLAVSADVFMSKLQSVGFNRFRIVELSKEDFPGLNVE